MKNLNIVLMLYIMSNLSLYGLPIAKDIYGVPIREDIFALSSAETRAEHDRNLAEFIKFANRYGCSEEVEKLSSSQVINNPSFHMKRGISRLVNRIRLQRFIQDNGIVGINVPQKCWSQRFQKVVSSNVPHVDRKSFKKSGRKLTLGEVQNLAKIIEGTALNDLNYPNLCLTTEDRLALIDLENKSFFAASTFAGVRRGLASLSSYPMKAEAQEWLDKRYDEVEKLEAAKDWDERVQAALTRNKQYDDSDIDFNRVKMAIDGNIDL